MDNSKEVEKDGAADNDAMVVDAVAADNDAMLVDDKAEAEKELAGGGEEEKGLGVDSENQGMEVDEERPSEAKDEELDQCKEVKEGNETVETKPDNNGELGKVESNKSVNDVAKHLVEEKGCVENSPVDESSGGEHLVPVNQQKDSVLVEAKNEKPVELSKDAAGMEVSVEDVAKKEEFSNGLIPEKLNGAKDEILKNEVKLAKEDVPKRGVTEGQLVGRDVGTEGEPATQVKEKLLKPEPGRGLEVEVKTPPKSFLYDTDADGYESGTEEEQGAFIKELEVFHRERGLDFKPPKFYQEKLNLLKLWRSVIKLGGYEQVTSCKLWRQVGESFKPPKTCTTVSWTFRGFYEKSLLEYEKQKILSGELPEIDASFSGSMSAGTQAGLSQAPGSGRARRDAAARAMQGWHSMRLLSNGEVGDPIIKDKNPMSLGKREKPLKSIGLLKRRKESPIEHTSKVGHLKSPKSQSETMVVDIGPPADWVKINVQRTKDCFEVYALVPGLLREEVRVQSDPAGRLVISGQPEQLDNPWGVTPFKKVVTLPSRIDPHQTSAVVTLHGQLFVRVPFEQSDT